MHFIPLRGLNPVVGVVILVIILLYFQRAFLNNLMDQSISSEPHPVSLSSPPFSYDEQVDPPPSHILSKADVQNATPKPNKARELQKPKEVAPTSKGTGKTLKEASKPASPGKFPYNVFLLYIDDLRYTLDEPNTGTHALHQVRTWDGAVSFKNAHSNYPLCCPSRTSMLTGLRPLVTRRATVTPLGGVTRKDWVQPHTTTLPDVTTLPGFFKKRGFHTSGVGKVFHDSTYRPTGSSEGDWTTWKVVDFGKGHQGPFLCDQFKWNDTFKPEDITQPGVIETKERKFFHDGIQADDITTHHAIQFLTQGHKQLPKPNQRWFYAAGIFRPHGPYTHPTHFYNLAQQAGWITPKPWTTAYEFGAWHPENCGRGWGILAPHGYAQTRPICNSDFDTWAACEPFPDVFQEVVANLSSIYLGSLMYSSWLTEKILKAFRDSPVYNNTIFVAVSDHGYTMAEGATPGKLQLRDFATRTPLVIRSPEFSGKIPEGMVSDRFVEHIDIFPTLLDLAKICKGGKKQKEECFGNLSGKSLRPIFEKKFLPGTENFVITELWNNQPERPIISGHYGLSIRTNQYRYSVWLPQQDVNKYILGQKTVDLSKVVWDNRDKYFQHREYMKTTVNDYKCKKPRKHQPHVPPKKFEWNGTEIWLSLFEYPKPLKTKEPAGEPIQPHFVEHENIVHDADLGLIQRLHDKLMAKLKVDFLKGESMIAKKYYNQFV